MGCKINYEELKKLLTEKYLAKEIGWDEILSIRRYGNVDKYNTYMLTEEEMENTNNRFFLIDDQEILQRYSYPEPNSTQVVSEYMLIILGLDETDSTVIDIFYTMTCQTDIHKDICHLNEYVYPKKTRKDKRD